MKINKCAGCGRYTLKKNCPGCGSTAHHVRPAKYSPEDAYGRYRRMMKEESAPE